jgi:hypothetical protein
MPKMVSDQLFDILGDFCADVVSQACYRILDTFHVIEDNCIDSQCIAVMYRTPVGLYQLFLSSHMDIVILMWTICYVRF